MKEAFEIELHQKAGHAARGGSLRDPKKNRRQKRATEHDRREIGEEFGGVFQRR